MADLRYKLKTASFRNQSLQDILKSCSKAVELITVERYFGAVHNTKITLKMNHGDNVPLQERYYDRVHLYRRLNIRTVLPVGFVSSGDIEQDIEELNRLGCDFTEDDIMLQGNTIVAKEDSLGYHNYAEGMVDYIYCTMPQLASIKVNGVSLNIDPESLNDFELLDQHGIKVIDTYDSWGCGNIFRLQNKTSNVLNVDLDVGDNINGFDGFQLIPDQLNGSIQYFKPQEVFDGMSLYGRIKFGLSANVSYTEEEFDRFDKIGSTYNQILPTNLTYGKENVRFDIYLNDQLVVNSPLHDATTRNAATAALQQYFATNLLEGYGYVDSTSSIGNRTNLLLNQGSAVGVWLKVKIDAIYTAGQILPSDSDGVLTAWNTVITQNKKSVEYFLYDPINFNF
jgi:hypothetical protein